MQVGRALVLKSVCFEDPVWEDRIDRVLKFTQRTGFIMELIGTDASRVRMKAYLRKRLQACGIEPNLPRGILPLYTSKAFLRPEDHRLEAAYLVALHYGQRGPGEFSEVEADLGQALDKRLEVYGRYRSDLYPFKATSQQSPRFGFEDYVVMIRGIQAKALAMHLCRECKGSHPYSTLHTVVSSCPFCNRMKLEMSKARAEVEQRIREHRSARLMSLSTAHDLVSLRMKIA